MDVLPGTRLGPYQVTGSLGAGGMGVVYAAVDTRLGRQVAVKLLPPDAAADPERRRRFVQEGRAEQALAALRRLFSTTSSSFLRSLMP